MHSLSDFPQKETSNSTVNQLRNNRFSKKLAPPMWALFKSCNIKTDSVQIPLPLSPPSAVGSDLTLAAAITTNIYSLLPSFLKNTPTNNTVIRPRRQLTQTPRINSFFFFRKQQTTTTQDIFTPHERKNEYIPILFGTSTESNKFGSENAFCFLRPQTLVIFFFFSHRRIG